MNHPIQGLEARWLPIGAAMIAAVLQSGCREPAPECTASVCAEWSDTPHGRPPPTSTASTTYREQPSRLTPKELEGIFPPTWKKGDHWRIGFWGPNIRFPGTPRVRYEGTFSVAGVPDGESDRFTLQFEGESSGVHLDATIEIRKEDFSVARHKNSWSDVRNGSTPYVGEQIPVFGFPSAPPGFPNRFFFDAGAFDFSAAQAWQEVSLEDPNTLDVMLVFRRQTDLQQKRFVGTWRRGDPWWSTLKCYSFGHVERREAGSLVEIDGCDMVLLRDESPEKTGR